MLNGRATHDLIVEARLTGWSAKTTGGFISIQFGGDTTVLGTVDNITADHLN